MAAGSAGAGSGLAYRIIESQYRLNIPRLFAALVLLAATGIGLYLLLAALNHVLLRRWHESALRCGIMRLNLFSLLIVCRLVIVPSRVPAMVRLQTMRGATDDGQR